MSTREVCDYLGISRATLYNRIKAGELTPLPTTAALKKAPQKFDRAQVEAHKAGMVGVEANAAEHREG